MVNKYPNKQIGKLGFTLTELLTAVSIIAILVLMAMLVMNYKTQIQKARDTKRKNDLSVIKAKLEDYYNDNESYPPPPGCTEDSCCLEIDCNSNFLSPSLPKFPCDPRGKKYLYCAGRVKSQWYKIYTNLENINDKLIEEAGCKNNCLVSGKCYNYGLSSSNTSIITEQFCQGESQTEESSAVNLYTACQSGRCNIVGDPESLCPPPLGHCQGQVCLPECFLNDPTCRNCNGAGCLLNCLSN